MTTRFDLSLLARRMDGKQYPTVITPGELSALIRVVRAAARINELVGTETEEGQDAAWEELDAALAPFGFGPRESA